MNINFDDGFREFTINSDPERKIRFNPTDMNIIKRFDEAREVIREKCNSLISTDATEIATEDGYAENIQLLSDVDDLIKEQTDYIFNDKVSSFVYGKQSPLTLINGEYLFEKILHALFMHVSGEIEKENSKNKTRMEKYLVNDHKKKQGKKKNDR